MADRTFHKRFNTTARVGVVVFALLAGYFFWVKMAIIGIFVAIIIVGMIERILNTTYTFKKVKPIDRDDEMEYLIINEGRFLFQQECAGMRHHQRAYRQDLSGIGSLSGDRIRTS